MLSSVFWNERLPFLLWLLWTVTVYGLHELWLTSVQLIGACTWYCTSGIIRILKTWGQILAILPSRVQRQSPWWGIWDEAVGKCSIGSEPSEAEQYCLSDTVKPVMFACRLLCELNRTAKLKGVSMCLMFMDDLKLLVLELCGLVEFTKIKGTKIILHVKSTTFRASKLEGFTVAGIAANFPHITLGPQTKGWVAAQSALPLIHHYIAPIVVIGVCAMFYDDDIREHCTLINDFMVLF